MCKYVVKYIMQPRAVASQRYLAENVRAPKIAKLGYKIATYKMAWKAQPINED